MDIVPKIAIKIARQVVPGEIHQASLIATNFVQGGRRRKELLRPARAGELGGFGVTEASLLAWIFHAMTEAAPFITGFLASKTLENSSLIVSEIHTALDTRKSAYQGQARSGEQHGVPSSPPQSQLYTGPKQLQQCVVALGKALHKAGMPLEESETTAYKVIEVLWEEVPEALVFVRKITEKK